MANVDRDWNQRYLDGQTPWDSGLPSRELQHILRESEIPRGRALDLGCGSGTNAVFLAQQGFRTTGVDAAAEGLALARRRADQAGVEVDWIEADVQGLSLAGGPFDFVFDRGCYHCCRRVDLDGYLATVRNATRPGSLMVCLAGNADETSEYGPPRVTAAELIGEFEPLMHIRQLRPFRFQDADEREGPLGWSLVLERRARE
ncbi:MAG: methyltransferase domain-containing protein [Planctomyces sp.]|nr:methyltransferase domain-containing protein [Planctomyces sp.]